MTTTLDEKSRLSVPGSVAVAFLFAWLLYLTRSVESVKTDVAVIRAHIETRGASVVGSGTDEAGGSADSSVAKHSR